MTRLFGTDGIRGVAGVDITQGLASSFGHAALSVLASGVEAPLVVVGRDPRPSGPELSRGLSNAMLNLGATVIDLGVIPTPAVAHAVAAGLPGLDRLPDFGVVVSASHNPANDNGLKLFGRGGVKPPTTVEAAVEAEIIRLEHIPHRLPLRLPREFADHGWYVDHLLAAVTDLGGLPPLRIVLDCANGAAAELAPAVFAAAGAEVIAIGTGSGDAINHGCGATHLDQLRAKVVVEAADLGLAFDGDADRCLAVDENGDVVDGDAILAILASALKSTGRLRGDAIAATVMSNQGLVVALAEQGIGVRRTDVGDRAVLERMAADDLSLGGEQSGHIVLSDYATTGDGMLTGLALAAQVSPSRKLSKQAGMVTPMPQVLVNVRVADKLAALAAAAAETAAVEAELGSAGRVLVRPSGTEPLLRVMVEAASIELANTAAARIAAAVEPQSGS